MATSHLRTAALLVAGITLTASPLFAQRDGRRNSGEGGRREAVERGSARGGGESRARESQPRGESQPRVESRRRDEARERVQPDRHLDNRSHNNRSSGNRAYTYRPYSHRSYVVPYGYRPYGYRPGWNLNLYFGRPYTPYGYAGDYGYYAIAPGFSYGSVRIVDAPRDAQVFVDGNYAGVVDDYDGVFQHLNLEPGSHHIEIEAEADGNPPIAFDVRVDPGQTITYHAKMP
jgi:hypothetical protein